MFGLIWMKITIYNDNILTCVFYVVLLYSNGKMDHLDDFVGDTCDEN